MPRKLQTRWHRESGQSLIETGLMITVIFAVIFWIFELGWLMYTYSVMADAANEGVRHSIVASGGDPSGTQTVVKNFAGTSLQDIRAITVTVNDPEGDYVPPHLVTVTVKYTFVPWLSQFFPNPIAMTTYAEGRRVVP
jgi:Flp pilus assembly protein TadG